MPTDTPLVLFLFSKASETQGVVGASLTNKPMRRDPHLTLLALVVTEKMKTNKLEPWRMQR